MTWIAIFALLAQAPAKEIPSKQDVLWEKMTAEVARIAAGSDGVLGVAIRDLTGGREFGLHADHAYPTASTIKIAALVELYKQNRLEEVYVVDKKDLAGGSGLMGGFTPGVTKLTFRDLATLMVGVSDNSATNILADRLDLAKINATLDSLGMKITRFRRNMFDTAGARKGLENTASPRELVRLMAAVHEGKVLGKEATADFWRMLGTSKQAFLPALLPEGVRSATKPGWIEQVRVDAGVIFARNRPFAIAVMGAYLRDGKAAERQIAEICLAAWKYFDIVGASTDLGRRTP